MRASRRKGLILSVVLVMIGLLSLVMAGYIYFLRAETAGLRAASDSQQARLAAESGLEEIIALLRVSPQSPAAWFDNPSRLRHALVWGQGFDRESDPIREARSRREFLASQDKRTPAWRYSAVAPRLDGPEGTIRFGITPESGKLDINIASEQQLADLMLPLLAELSVENPEQLVAALLDWRDDDADPRDGGAENEYYNTLEPPYNAKQTGRIDTIEELLLVKGFNAAVLYGEDVNRNGILDENENDGDASPPLYDNGDGVLNHGIAPFLTVWSVEVDRASDNRPRINLNDDMTKILERMEKYFPNGEIGEAIIDPLTSLKGGTPSFSDYPSIASVFVIPDGSSLDPNEAGGGSGAGGRAGGRGGQESGEDERDPNASGGGSRRDGRDGSDRSKSDERSQDRGDRGEATREERGGRLQRTGAPQQFGPRQTADGGGRAGPGSAQQLPTITVGPEELTLLLDYFSVRVNGAMQPVQGLINVNTAPARVLALIPGLPPEVVPTLIEVRNRLGADKLRSYAWLRTEGVLNQAQFERVAPAITASAYQFTVEVFAYADHANASARMEWVIDVLGMAPQIRYHRDLTRLGPGWPVDSETVIVAQP